MILGKGPLRLGTVAALFALLLGIGLATTGVAHAQSIPGPRFFGYAEAGDEVEASIDGIGTLRLSVVAGEKPPGETGARLPPVKSYRE